MSRLASILKSLGGALRTERAAAQRAPERRDQPRVSKRLTVHAAAHALTSTNVSQSGLQVTCPAVWLRSLQDGWNREAVALTIELPDGRLMDVECAVTYVSECEDEFLIGFRFNRAEDAHREPWQSYLTQLYGAGNIPGAANAA